MTLSEFDYENVDPETLKEWRREHRRKCWLEMRAYLKDFPDATPEERQELREWVKSGHSPYENGDYIATESGWSMDFIHARRFLEEMYQEYLKDPEGYRGKPDSCESFSINQDPGGDLPF